MKQTPGKIFLAEQRGHLETAQFRRHCTFNFGAYAAPHREPFGPLLAVNEETLAGGATVVLPAAQAAQVLVVPVTGAVRAGWGPTAATSALLDVEEMGLLAVPAGGALHLTNPHADALITLLHIWLAAEGVAEAVAGAPACQRFAFDAAGLANRLAGVVPAAGPAGAPRPFRASLGRFDGRAEAVYCLHSSTARFFAFVLAGAFEVEGRLLHAHDGLALWDVPDVELEALSNDALVLVLELELPAA